jgi:hypothetical protein
MSTNNLPATKKQLYALWCITKEDYRNKGLTVSEASELISKYKQESGNKRKDINYEEDIYQYLVSKHDDIYNVFLKEIGITSDLVNEFNSSDRYVFLGSGCGFTWVEFDARSKIAKMLFEKYDSPLYDAIAKYKSYFISKLPVDLKSKLQQLGNPIGAIIGQNMEINTCILSIAVKYCIDTYKIKKAYVRSRLD